MKVFEIVAAHKLVSYKAGVLAGEHQERNESNKEPSMRADEPVFPHIGT